MSNYAESSSMAAARGQKRQRVGPTHYGGYKPKQLNFSRAKYQSSLKAPTMPRINETKYVDGYLDTVSVHQLSSTADDTWADTELNPRQQTSVYGCLPVPRQGTNYSDRDGRKIWVKNIRISGQIRWTSVANNATPLTISPVRIVIVKDSRTNSTTLSGENVIGPGLGSDGLATLSGDGVALNLPTNPDGWGRYRILHDQTFNPPAIAASGDSTNLDQQGLYLDFSITVRPSCYISFDASTGAIGSIIDNSFHVLAATNAGGTDQQLCYYARTSFIG